MKSALPGVLRVGLVGVLGLFYGCTDDPVPVADAALACTDPAQISLPNCTAGPDRFSDEACTGLDDAIARVATNDAQAPTVVAPTEGQAVPSATPFVFRWDEPTAALPLLPRVHPRGRAFSWRDDLARWSVLVPEAHAHCTPFSGRAYELQFRVAGRLVLRRQQSSTSYTPGPDAWDRLRTAGGPVELTVVTALFNQNVIFPGNGPFAPSAPRRFTLAP